MHPLNEMSLQICIIYAVSVRQEGCRGLLIKFRRHSNLLRAYLVQLTERSDDLSTAEGAI